MAAQSDSHKTQLVVIGAGPGGYAAAFHAADLGLDVTLVNAEVKPGGVCLHRGCIPSKGLLHAARVINAAKEAESFGIKFRKPKIDLDALRAWKDGVVEQLADGITRLSRGRKVKLFEARATFEDSATLRLSAVGRGGAKIPGRIRFDHAIVATGSRPATPKALAVADRRVMDSTSALELPEIPDSLLVVGGGYIGLELGTVYAALGSKVTVVELTGGLLPEVDRDLVRPLQKHLETSFAAIHLNTKVQGLTPAQDGIAVSLRGDGMKGKQTFDRVLISVGRQPVTDGLGLENTGVRVDDGGFIRVNDRMRTDDPNVFAIGDVAGNPMLAHKASREGKVAAEVIAGQKTVFDNIAVPAVVFTDPEVAWCGLTETDAARQGREVAVARFPWSASGRALALGRTEGLTKLVIDPQTERVLGVGIVGVGAGDLIAEGVLAVEMAAVVRDVADSIHPHPTLSETVGEAAEAFLGHAIHIGPPRK